MCRLARPVSSALLVASVVASPINTSVIRRAAAVSSALGSVTSVAGGQAFSCAVSGGGVKCWGKNDAGQLGNGTTISSTFPVAVTGLSSGVSAVSTGANYACALLVNGTVSCWGANANGQFGNGTNVSSSTPVDVSLAGVTAVSAGVSSTCFIVAGEVQCAGSNTYGQLGDGSTTESFWPVSTGLFSGSSVSVGNEFACAVDDGATMCWGRNNNRQLGHNSSVTSSLTPVGSTGIGTGQLVVATGKDHACSLSTSGAMKCWGANNVGQVGDATTVRKSTPTDVSGLGSGVTAISARDTSTCAVVSQVVQCWGGNAYGQVGDGTTVSRSTPTAVSGVSATSVVVNGDRHACAISSTATVKCWGGNADGQLGNAVPAFRSVASLTTTGVSQVSAGGRHACVVRSGGVQCWGGNDYGQVGDGTNTSRTTAVAASGLASGVTSLATGELHSCAVVSGGAKCWGRNNLGQLGDGSTSNSSSPVDVTGLTTGVVSVVAGVSFSCALLTNGGVRCWGENGVGQLGNGSIASEASPVGVAGLSGGVSALAAGDFHACALLASTAVKCWGMNTAGQLGNGLTTDSNEPVVAFGGATGISQISLGANNTMVLVGGAAKCVGSDGAGGVCGGTGADAVALTEAQGLSSGVTSVASGNDAACAVVSGGVRCWGKNDVGQLGNNATSANVATAAHVAGMTSNVSSVVMARSSGDYVCALLSSGDLYCWGGNTYGQLGNGEAAINVLAATVNVAEVPAAPGNVRATPSGTSIVVEWDASLGNGGAAIELYRLTEATTSTTCITLSATSCVVSGLTLATSYTFSVEAENIVGVSSAGTVTASTTGYPGVPTGVAVSTSDESLDVSWLAPSDTGGTSLLGYTVYVNTVARCTTLVASTNPLQCSVGSLTNGTSYSVTVKAENVNGFGAASLAESGVPATVPSAPSVVVLVEGDRQLTLSITPSGNGGSAVTSYDYSTDAGATWRARTDGGGSSTTLVVARQSSGAGADLSNAGAYLVCVRARNAKGPSLASNCDVGEPYSAPPVAVDDVMQANERGSFTFDPRVNDSDPEGHALVVTQINTSGTMGSASFTSAGITYHADGFYDQLAVGQTSVDYLDYTVADRDQITDTARITIHITGLNNAPVAFSDTASVRADAGATALSLVANDGDVDYGDTLTVSAVSTTYTRGAVTLTNGVVRYAPNAMFDYVLVGENGTDAFSYTVVDAHGATSSATVTITVVGTAQPSTPSSSTSSSTTSSTTTTTSSILPANTASTSTAPTTAVKARQGVLEAAPKKIGMLRAVQVLASSEVRSMRLVMMTPHTCLATSTHVVAVAVGLCKVQMKSVTGARKNITWKSVVVKAAQDIGSQVVELKPIPFRYMSAVPTVYTAPFIAEARTARNVLVVGHAALFAGEVYWNPGISLQRANNVKKLLISKGVKGRTTALGLGARVPLSYELVESEQYVNRRVMVYLFS